MSLYRDPTREEYLAKTKELGIHPAAAFFKRERARAALDELDKLIADNTQPASAMTYVEGKGVVDKPLPVDPVWVAIATLVDLHRKIGDLPRES